MMIAGADGDFGRYAVSIQMWTLFVLQTLGIIGSSCWTRYLRLDKYCQIHTQRSNP
jgi:hypothetical protein